MLCLRSGAGGRAWAVGGRWSFGRTPVGVWLSRRGADLAASATGVHAGHLAPVCRIGVGGAAGVGAMTAIYLFLIYHDETFLSE